MYAICRVVLIKLCLTSITLFLSLSIVHTAGGDPYSATPWDAICARGDLDPEEPDAYGCYDAKVRSNLVKHGQTWCMAHRGTRMAFGAREQLGAGLTCVS